MTIDTSTRPDTGAAYDEHAQVHLGVFYTGVGPQLLWSDPSAREHVAIETFVEVAQLLERGLFDAFFLGEGLRVRENRGRVYDLDVAGRPTPSPNCPRWREPPSSSAWSPPRTPPTTSPPTLPAAWRAWICSPRVAPAGTS